MTIEDKILIAAGEEFHRLGFNAEFLIIRNRRKKDVAQGS